MKSSTSHADESLRARLVSGILDFLGHDLIDSASIRAALLSEIDAAGPPALLDLHQRLTLERGWNYYPPDPLARRVHHALAERFLHPRSALIGADNLATIDTSRVVLVSNHVSYADANVIEVLFHRAGFIALAGRLTALAGPKVFTSRERRFSSLCFGTIKVPQSAEVASGEAAMGARDVARAAREAIAVAHARLDAGDALIVFGEGTRSRTAAMQPLLPAATRYVDAPDIWITPVGLTGSESLFPVDTSTVRPATVTATVGTPLSARALWTAVDGNRRSMADALGLAIAELLPPDYRGVYDGGRGTQARMQLRAAART